MAFLPATFAINPNFDVKNLNDDIIKIGLEVNKIDVHALKTEDASVATELKKNVGDLQSEIVKKDAIDRKNIRSNILRIQKNYKTLSTKKLAFIPQANAG